MRDDLALPDLMRSHPQNSLRAFCETFLLNTWVTDVWTSSQVSVLSGLQQTIRQGGSREAELDRGQGATTLLAAAALWAIAASHRQNILFLADSFERAVNAVERIAREPNRNPDLQDAFKIHSVDRRGSTITFRIDGQRACIHAHGLGVLPMGIRPDLVLADNCVAWGSGSPRLIAAGERELTSLFHVQPTFAIRSRG